jgi:glycosyltransferase involved in cell wall biosynthesis
MKLTILSVGYPFAAAGPGAVGGAEQILSRLDRALVANGHKSCVIAPADSYTWGQLFPVRSVNALIDDELRHITYAEVRLLLETAIDECRPSVVHLHGVDFYHYLPSVPVPTLVTLHLPISFYPREIFCLEQKNIFLHCVSDSQDRTCPPFARLLPPIPNGVPLPPAKGIRQEERKFALCLSRVAPEKNVHSAIEAARLAGVDLQIAGRVFPYPSHQRYFDEEIQPRLSKRYRFLGPVDEPTKWSLLARARCLLQPSLAAETSSLVAMEALASATPVIAFRSGALPDIVTDNKTGFLVNTVEEMAAAINKVERLNPKDCRTAAKTQFGLDCMIQQYFAVYRYLVGTHGSGSGVRVPGDVDVRRLTRGSASLPNAISSPSFFLT